jgi:hypothetical protein
MGRAGVAGVGGKELSVNSSIRIKKGCDGPARVGVGWGGSPTMSPAAYAVVEMTGGEEDGYTGIERRKTRGGRCVRRYARALGMKAMGVAHH